MSFMDLSSASLVLPKGRRGRPALASAAAVRLTAAILALAAPLTVALLLGVAASRRPGALGAGSAPTVAAVAPGPAGNALVALPAVALTEISRDLGRDQSGYRITRAPVPDRGRATARWGAASLSFSGWGVEASVPGAQVGLTLDRVGAIRVSGTAPGVTRLHANQLSLSAVGGGLVEEFVNGPGGLEQAWVVGQRVGNVSVGSPGGELTLTLGLTRSIRASLSSDGRAVLLRSGDGPVAFTYSNLSVHDSAGRAVPAELAVAGRTILVRVDTRGVSFPLTIDPLLRSAATSVASADDEDEMGQVLAPSDAANGLIGAKFGYSVAISTDGQTILVGGPQDGNQPAPGATSPGAAWVFVRDGADWEQQGSKLTPSPRTTSCGWSTGNHAPCMAFGESVALSADGNTALIGAPALGWGGGPSSAWVFTRTGTTWTQQGGSLTAPGEATSCPDSSSICTSFGQNVALSDDGNTALIGDPATQAGSQADLGAAYVFTRSGSAWGLSSTIVPSDGVNTCQAGQNYCVYFGDSVSLSAGGTVALIGGSGDDAGTGAAWVYSNTGPGAWSETAKLVGTGRSAVGSSAGASYFGAEVALSGDASTAIVSGQAGEEWIFSSTGGTWTQQTTLNQDGDANGDTPAVALSTDGDVAVVGEPWVDNGAGDATLYTLDSNGDWSESQDLGADANGGFGASAAIAGDGSTTVIGSPGAGDDGSGETPGSAEAVETTHYRLILYTTAKSGQFYPLGHGFVQLREYSSDTDPTTDNCTTSGGVECQTFGEYPGSVVTARTGNCIGSFLANGLGNTTGCITSGDADSLWGWRIVYDIDKQQYNEAMSYVDQQLTAQSQGTLLYSLTVHNCLAFAVAVANAAGLAVPNYKLDTTPDPRTLANSLAAVGNGNSVDGGTVEMTDGSTASGAPDPTMPEDPSSVTDMVAAALNDPGELASTVGFGSGTLTLPDQNVGTGGELTLTGTGSLPTGAIYGIDWGDGSATDIGITSSLNPGFTPSFTHAYTAPETYAVQMVVLDGNVEDYTLSVTVGAGSASATADFGVPTPPTSWDYPYTYAEASYGPLAGAPGAPTIDGATLGNDSATVTFDAPADPGDSPITGYTVTATDLTAPANGGQTASGTGSPITVSGLTTGDSYTFTVTASNNEGPGTPSTASGAITAAAGGASGSGGAGSGSGSSGSGANGSGSDGSGSGAAGSPGSTSVASAGSSQTKAGRLRLLAVKVIGRRVSVKLGCAGTAGRTCRAVLTLSASETVKKKTQTVTVARDSATLSQGHTRTLRIALDGIGLRLLAQHASLPIHIWVTSGGAGAAITRTVQFRR